MKFCRCAVFVLVLTTIGLARAEDTSDPLPADAGLSDEDRLLAHDTSVLRKVTTDEAGFLVGVALGWKHPRSLEYLDWDLGMAPPFITYTVLGRHSAISGYFLVNPWTGRLWDVWGCKWMDSPTLKREQVKIRTRFRAEELKQYDALNKIQPPCEFGE
jgi:hypothetical protein